MALITRRSLLVGAASLLAAPAIVRVQNIMPVKAVLLPAEKWMPDLVTINGIDHLFGAAKNVVVFGYKMERSTLSATWLPITEVRKAVVPWKHFREEGFVAQAFDWQKV